MKLAEYSCAKGTVSLEFNQNTDRLILRSVLKDGTIESQGMEKSCLSSALGMFRYKCRALAPELEELRGILDVS